MGCANVARFAGYGKPLWSQTTGLVQIAATRAMFLTGVLLNGLNRGGDAERL